MMDLDKFKNINDTYGHDFGDVYLKHMAKEMLCLPKEHCIAARRSGDEFCLFLYGYSTREELLDAADSFWKQLAEETLVFPDGTARAIGVSGGLAWAQEHVSFPRMMYNADVALYQAKRETLSTYKIFGETKKEQPE